MKQAVVFRHVAFEDAGTLGPVLTERGYDIQWLEMGPSPIPAELAIAADLLLVLGGPIGAYEEDLYPFLRDEIRVLEGRLGADLPTLGICLGAQLMARALGARVYPGTEKEIGWAPLDLTPAGRDSELAPLAGSGLSVLHWHGDTFDLPAGACRLASTPITPNQAFAWGRRGLGLQFHVEVTELGLERWLIGHACEIGATPGITVPALRAQTRAHAPALEELSIGIWRQWLDMVEDSAGSG
jgi:GMP synthase (glutamine-hydrolysing)